MHVVAVVAFDGVVPVDLATPCDLFARVRLPSGKPAYEVRVCGVTPEVDAGAFVLRAPFGLSELARADTIMVPGIHALSVVPSPRLLRALRKAAAEGTRIASICSGAFVLAAAGLLDHRRATTHWLAAAELARRHPLITVDPNVLYVDEGAILTSAGAAAGLDLCLHIVRRDLGAAAAAEAARMAVMPLERAGGQAQFIVHAPPTPEGSSLAELLHWLEHNLHRPLTLRDMARKAAWSVRTLNRRFHEQAGTTPLRWLLRARVCRAQALLETTEHSVEGIAARVGFRSATAFRAHFSRVAGTSPQAYRRTFQAAPARLLRLRA
jgi:transcriptional regulator GlxA family with amidase domain